MQNVRKEKVTLLGVMTEASRFRGSLSAELIQVLQHVTVERWHNSHGGIGQSSMTEERQ